MVVVVLLIVVVGVPGKLSLLIVVIVVVVKVASEKKKIVIAHTYLQFAFYGNDEPSNIYTPKGYSFCSTSYLERNSPKHGKCETG